MNVPEHIITTHLAHLENEAEHAATEGEAIAKRGGASALRAVLGEARNDASIAARRIDITIIDGELVSIHSHTQPDGSDEPVELR